ncbi:matrix metalloproteinase-2-like isoform X2 [Physella acuta]|uniref:matrix metalloproteinase-2-like isoform X2 n=1 Tax=Physella acuta TaxID=109671 RepID=UPI0027DBFE2F|nr:matrix metalloproteinase-2-like isoform X2 [Physella acuta]
MEESKLSREKYLGQFGYLKGPSRETQNLMSQDDLKKAIKALQKAGGVPETGVIDHRTQVLMGRARCGNTDDFVEEPKGEHDYRIRLRRYTTGSSKWPRTNLTFRFVNYTPDMPVVKTRELISAALRVWSDATPLSFKEVLDPSADIEIMFASHFHQDGYPFDGKGMVLGHAFFPGAGKGGDTHFDDDENWTTNSTDGVDLFMVAAHEFGHALGLAHSGDPSALMYPWYMGFEGKFKLPEDDLRGITSLYGTGEKDNNLPGVDLINSNGERIPTVTKSAIDPTVIPKDSQPPDPCKSHLDAITIFRNEIFIFIGKWFWRLDSRRMIPRPIGIHQFWYNLPHSVEKIDAVFERPDGKLVFFSGDRYWVYNANHLSAGFPAEGRPLTDFSIPADVPRIDAAFIWGYNKRTYLVSGDMYWKMNENNTFVEYDYPRDMRTWKNVPVPLDAAFNDYHGVTYFFQGLMFYEFYDPKMHVKVGYPKQISTHWLNCGPNSVIQNVTSTSTENDSSREKHSSLLLLVLLLCYKIIFF